MPDRFYFMQQDYIDQLNQLNLETQAALGNAGGSAGAAAQSAQDAANSAASALASKDFVQTGVTLAQSWATKPSGEVTAGQGYSAMYYSLAAGTSASDALAYRNTTAGYVSTALGYRDNALASATLAQNWATQNTGEVVGGQGFSAKYWAGAASTSAGNASTSAGEALGYRNTTSGYVTTTLGYRDAANTAATLAQNWATQASGEVVTGQGFSAKKHAVDAAASAAAAFQSAQNASAGQVNSDWNSVSGLSQILNKPTIPTNKTQIGLPNVDNTSDLAKPVSTAQQTALDLKANRAAPTLTGQTTVDTLVSNSGVGVGGGVSASQTLRVTKAITGGTVAMGVQNDGVIQADVTAIAVGYNTNLKTVASAFTLTNLYHFLCAQSALGAGSVVTNQSGYAVDASMTGATNNFAFHGNLVAGTGRWNIYMPGTASNYMAGKLLIGVGVGDSGEQFQLLGTAKFNGNVTFLGTVTGVTKTHVGLSNVDNTSDALKPVSTAQQAALDGKLSLAGGTLTGPIAEKTGAMPALVIAAANGAIQTKTIAAPSTFTDSLAVGQSVVLMLTGGSSFAVTWPTVNWISPTGNVAPVLTAKSTILFFKEGTTLYGSYIGSFV